MIGAATADGPCDATIHSWVKIKPNPKASVTNNVLAFKGYYPFIGRVGYTS
jgi:hypothetical protein